MLLFQNGESFASGGVHYLYNSPNGDRDSSRIILTISVGHLQTTAFVDTGGSWVLCGPELAPALGLNPNEGAPGNLIRWRGALLEGTIYKVPLTLHADASMGSDLVVEAALFVPELQPNQAWIEDFPLILGMSGCLEFLRFAVDPGEDIFYFGPLV